MFISCNEKNIEGDNPSFCRQYFISFIYFIEKADKLLQLLINTKNINSIFLRIRPFLRKITTRNYTTLVQHFKTRMRIE